MQAKMAVLLAVIMALALAGDVSAQLKPFNFEVGPEFEYYQYREPGVMKETGGLFGGYMLFRATVASRLDARMFGSAAGGELKYEGSTWAGDALEIDTPNWLLNFRPTLGFALYAGDTVVIPYAGVALRYVQDDLAANYSGGYMRQNTYLYSPLGVEVRQYAGAWTFGLCGEFDVFWRGTNRNKDIPIGYSKYSETMTQTSGYGIQGSVFAKAQVSPAFELSMEPFISYWDIGKSDTKTLRTEYGDISIYEPENNTLTVGCRLGLGW